MQDIERPRAALREERLPAWLLCNLFHRDEAADRVLGVPREATNTRPWLCFLFADRPPIKIVHGIEASILDHVPGETIRYATREQLASALARAVPRGADVAADFSPTIPVGSFLDHGTALLVESFGCRLVTAENLVARCLGTVDESGIRSQDAAAGVLRAAIADAWDQVNQRANGRHAPTEGDLRDLIASRIARAGLVSDGPPIVAAGRNTNDPHYRIAGTGASLAAGDVVQFDVWARQTSKDAVYADISWVGVVARTPSAQQAQLFDAVVQAREEAIHAIERGLAERTAIRGADVDAAARSALIARGYGDFLRHRTGHSIGSTVHGLGVNLDSVEFPDNRILPDGACFSIEPGVYLPEHGMRSEVDCWIHDGRLRVTGPDRQRSLLLLE